MSVSPCKEEPLIGESLISERWYATYIYNLNTIKQNMVMETCNVVAAKNLHNRLWQCNVEVLAYSHNYLWITLKYRVK